MSRKSEKNHYNVTETDIEEVKQQARKSGLSYNEAIDWIAKTTGGKGTDVYSDTNKAAVKEENEQSMKSTEQ